MIHPDLDAIGTRLLEQERAFASRQNLSVWPLRARALALDLIDLSDADPDAALGAAHLDVRLPYGVSHHLMAGLICARLAPIAGLRHGDRLSLVAAALTHDLALTCDRRDIEAAEDLSPDQMEKVRLHPMQGAAMLAAMGVEDAVWLDVVRDHHEYLDGSGYRGKSASAISVPARIMVIADAFSAMLRHRPYRERLHASDAVSILGANADGRYDGVFVQALVTSLGPYPPGSPVKLSSGEWAVVLRNNAEYPRRPMVALICDRQGHGYKAPCLKNIAEDGLDIVSALEPSLAGRSTLLLSQCWKLASSEGASRRVDANTGKR